MASTLELGFTATKHHLLTDAPQQLVGEVNVDALEEYIEEIWKKFDTPPLSPERRHNDLVRAAAKLGVQPSSKPERQSSSSSSSDLVACVAQLAQLDGSDPTYPLLGQILECEQQLLGGFDEDAQSDSQGSSIAADLVDLESNLIQDCMWNSQSYEPRHFYTPASSPTPTSLSSPASSGDEMDTTDASKAQHGSSDQKPLSDGVIPQSSDTSNVVSGLKAKPEKVTRGAVKTKRLNLSSANPRTQLQAQTSLSESGTCRVFGGSVPH